MEGHCSPGWAERKATSPRDRPQETGVEYLTQQLTQRPKWPPLVTRPLQLCCSFYNSEQLSGAGPSSRPTFQPLRPWGCVFGKGSRSISQVSTGRLGGGGVGTGQKFLPRPLTQAPDGYMGPGQLSRGLGWSAQRAARRWGHRQSKVHGELKYSVKTQIHIELKKAS